MNNPIRNLVCLEEQLEYTDRQKLLEICRELKTESVSQKLAGNIEHQYLLSEEGIEIIRPILNLALSGETNRRSWMIDAWVNFQKKHEFNPLHNHSGLWSFVLWLDIPYNIDDELSLPWVKNSNSPSASIFSLVHTNPLGELTTEDFFLDKKDNGRMLIFPSKMFHVVYPFYTSDDYRISISGNLV